MENNVIIGTALKRNVRVYLLNSKEVVEKARIYHDCWPTSLAALGRTLSVTALLGLMEKDENDIITTHINGGGKAGTILCTANSKGEVKGFIDNNHLYETYPNGKLAVGQIVGTDGYLTVIRDLKLKQSYNSKVELRSGEIGDDFAYYFLESQQIPSIVSVGVLVDTDDSCKSAGALIIEVLPGAKEEDIVYLENLKLEPITTVLSRDDNLMNYVNSLFNDFELLEEKNVTYYCDCSRERLEKKLITLPRRELFELALEGTFEVKCEFCDKKYTFTKEDIINLTKNA